MTLQPASARPVAPTPDAAITVFGARVDLAVRYAGLLVTEGVLRGLIGPREADRVWDRHLLNCAVLGELIDTGATVADLGSGAGLPGIPLAIARPDLRVELIEPMARRADFLREAVMALGLESVTVVRDRAEHAPRDRYDVVTARALAPLERLVPLALPLARVGGTLLAMKGVGAAAEIALAARAIEACGGSRPEVASVGVGHIEPATVVAIHRLRAVTASRHPGSSGRRA